ncbi:MAG TPA: histidine--tRNA ligase [Kiritimatiellia bacterium]|mgnify:FL=1|nr:histidine--tRNA ligase [Kiritimatiellia bacterium]
MGSEEFQPVQGMSDIASPDIAVWQLLEQQARGVFARYGFSEVRTPLVERRSVFEHSLGDTTDVVQKEMYQFEDAGGRALVLRPEGTAGMMRHLAGMGQDAANARVYYIGPMFRRERPQAGRKRQFHQCGAEAIGEPNAHADAEMIALQAHLLKEWGLQQSVIKINTRGAAADRAAVQRGMQEKLSAHRERLCDDCRRRLEVNVLRVLDCKNPGCREIVRTLPPMTAFMSDEARTYLEEVLRVIRRLELSVDVDPNLVRGLDYYQHTVWEISHPGLGAQDAVGAGGRYEISMGNRTLRGVGFAMGLERILMALASEKKTPEPAPLHGIWLVSLDHALLDIHLQLAQMLRMRGLDCGLDLNGRSVKAQMRAAGKSGARWVILHGAAEDEKGVFQLKDMLDGTQREVTMVELLEQLQR